MNDIDRFNALINDLRLYYFDEANKILLENVTKSFLENTISVKMNYAEINKPLLNNIEREVYSYVVSKSKSNVLQQIIRRGTARIKANIPEELSKEEAFLKTRIRKQVSV